MSLDLTKLKQVVDLPGGGKQAQCPACAEAGQDSTGNHLRIYKDGRFGCCAHAGDTAHRSRIFALVGDRGCKSIQVKPALVTDLGPLKRDILAQLAVTVVPSDATMRTVGVEERGPAADGERPTSEPPIPPIAGSRTPRTPPNDSVYRKEDVVVLEEKDSETGVRGVRTSPTLPSSPLSAVPVPSSQTVRLVTDRTDLDRIAEVWRSANQPVALDIETYGQHKEDSLDPFRGEIRLLTLAIPGRDPWLLDLRALGYDLGPLKPVLESVEVVGHNLKFDALWLRVKCGLRLTKVFCTYTASRLLTNGTHQRNDLGECLRRHIGVDLPKDQGRSNWGAAELTPEQLAYAADDVRHLRALKAALEAALQESSLTDVARLEMDLLPVVVEMEAHGIGVDSQRLQAIQERATAKAKALEQQMRELTGDPAFNPRSQPQLLDKLRRYGFNLPNTNKETLPACPHPLAALVLEYRGVEQQAKQAEGLLKASDGDGRIHASFNPLGAETGRFSSSDPNLQNVGRGELRSCFVPPPGMVLVIADYSQIELRVVAAIAQEMKMVRAYQEGADLHRQTASLVLGKSPDQVTKEDRQLAKAVNFGLIYGQQPKGLVDYAKSGYGVKLSLREAISLRTRFFQAYANLARWHQLNDKKARNIAAEVRTVTKRRRLLPREPGRDGNWKRFTGLVNTPVQGGSADGLKLAMIALARQLPSSAHIVSTVHDELIVEVPQGLAEQVKAMVRDCMVQAMAKLFPQVPIEAEVKIASNWGEK